MQIAIKNIDQDIVDKIIDIWKVFQNTNINHRKRIEKINDLITQHEEKLSNILLDFLKSKKKVRIIGKKISENKNRAPTISFTIENETSKKVP